LNIILVERHFRSKIDLEKTANINWLRFSLSVTTSTDAFLHEGNVWTHYQSEMWSRSQQLLDVGARAGA